MATNDDHLAEYLKHVRARARSKNRKPAPEDQPFVALSPDIAAFCTREPAACLQLILRALEQADGPDVIEAIGSELLENLINENSGPVGGEVTELLRTNVRFRQAFSFGNYSSVDPDLLDDWVRVFRDLGTTKAAERKSLRSRRS